MVGFLFGGNTGETAESLASKRQLAQAMLQSAMGGEKIQSPWQGVSEMARALMGGLMQRQMANEGAAQNAQLTAALMGQPYAPAADGGDFRDKAANWMFGSSSQPGQSDQTNGTFGKFLTGQGGAPAGSNQAAASVQSGGNLAPVQGSGDPQNALDAIMRFESAGKNVHQNIVPPGGGYNPSTGTVTGPSSASGYFQMINPTWKRAASMAGIDTSQYPTAMSAPYDVQRKAANALYASDGFSPWAPYNAALRGYIDKNGGASAFTGDADNTPPAVAAINAQMAQQPNASATSVGALGFAPEIGPQDFPAPSPVAPMSPQMTAVKQAISAAIPTPQITQADINRARQATIAAQSQGPIDTSGIIGQSGQQAPQQVAQNGQMDANYFPPAPQPPAQNAAPQTGMGSPRLAAAIAAMSSPYASGNVKALAQAMIQQELSPQNDFQTTPDGNILMINKRTGQVQPIYKAAKPPQWGQINSAGDMGWIDPVNHSISDAAGNPVTPGSQTGIKPTDEMRNYQYAKQNGYAGSFNDWELEQKKAGAQSVTIAGETEESKALGKARADNIVEYMNGGKAARDKLQALQIMEGALAAPGGTDFTTGPGAEMALKAKQALSSLTGQQLDGVTNAEIIKKTGAYLASAAAKDLASRPTQFDFKTFLENNPGLDISMQGNRLLINIMKQQAQHQMDLARMAQSYKGNSADWNDVVTEYDKSHPILNPMTGKPLAPSDTFGFPDASNGPKPGDVEGGYRFKGGSPGNPANWEKVE
ncbi:MAG TPA: hypothetical protein VN112_16235 [Ensifer sp.]|nr:hypothetical protein [Ensifer sp.]